MRSFVAFEYDKYGGVGVVLVVESAIPSCKDLLLQVRALLAMLVVDRAEEEVIERSAFVHTIMITVVLINIKSTRIRLLFFEIIGKDKRLIVFCPDVVQYWMDTVQSSLGKNGLSEGRLRMHSVENCTSGRMRGELS